MSAQKKILIAYYSRTGTTKKVARFLQRILKCDMEEIVDEKKRLGIFGYIRAGRDAMWKKQTHIEEPEKKTGAYDLVVIGSPIWAGSLTPAIRTYLRKYSKGMKTVAFFSTGGSMRSDLLADVESLCKKALSGSLCLREQEMESGKYQERTRKFAQMLAGKHK